MKGTLRRILLALLGFSAAPIMTACYAMPYDDYSNIPFEGLEGEVIDANTQKPIPNIKVHYSKDSANGKLEFHTQTDANGKFIFDDNHTFDHDITVHLSDVDDTENGLYQDRTFYASANFNKNRTIAMYPAEEKNE